MIPPRGARPSLPHVLSFAALALAASAARAQ